MKKSILPALRTPPTVRKVVLKMRRRFLRSRVYGLILDLRHNGIRHIGTVVEEMLTHDFKRLWALGEAYTLELRKKACCVSPIVNRIRDALDDVANRHIRCLENKGFILYKIA